MVEIYGFWFTCEGLFAQILFFFMCFSSLQLTSIASLNLRLSERPCIAAR